MSTVAHRAMSGRRWPRQGTPAHYAPTPRASQASHPRGSHLEPFKAYVRQRCKQGCWNGSRLYAEIQTLGFAGSLSLLRHFLTQVRKQQPAVAEASATSVCPHKVSILDPYKPYHVQRWKEGCWISRQLYAEVRIQGFVGSQPTVRNFLADLRQKQQLAGTAAALQWDGVQWPVVLPSELPATPEVMRRISPAQASWLVFLPAERLADYQRIQRERVRLSSRRRGGLYGGQ